MFNAIATVGFSYKAGAGFCTATLGGFAAVTSQVSKCCTFGGCRRKPNYKYSQRLWDMKSLTLWERPFCPECNANMKMSAGDGFICPKCWQG